MKRLSERDNMRVCQIKKCGHIFHRGCLSKWCKAKKDKAEMDCPICRVEIRNPNTDTVLRPLDFCVEIPQTKGDEEEGDDSTK